MKTEIQIRTGDFEYINRSSEIIMTHEEAVCWFNELKEAFKTPKVGEGLEKKAFDGFLDKMMMGGSIHVSDYEQMNGEQQVLIQAVKRSQARIKRLLDKQSEALDYHN